MTARYPTATFRWSLWNEPEGGNFWAGNTTQYTTMWGAVQAKLFSDYGILLGGPDTSSKVATSGGYQKALIDYATANGRPIGFICTHAYNSSPAVFAAEVAAIRAYLIAQGITNAATVPIGVTEWNLDLNIGNQRHDNSGASAASLFKQRNQFRDEFQAAFAHAMLSAALASGASFGIYTRMGILDAFYGSGERELGMFTNDNPPRPLPVYGAFQGMWKHSGNRVSATTNFPYLTALASKATNGKIVVTFANFRPWNGKQRKNISFEWAGLPTIYTWKLYRMDSRDAADGRLKLVASGDQTNPPIGADLEALGFGCIEVTP